MIPDESFYNHISKWEGGKADDKADRGGLTYRGITWYTYKAKCKKVLGFEPTKENFFNMTDSQWRKFVDEFWFNAKADKLKNKNIANLHTDIFWGSGYWAGALLVRALKTFGIKTFTDKGKDTPLSNELIMAVNSIDPAKFYVELTKQRIAKYNAIVKNNPTQQKFLQGWLNRSNDLFNKAKSQFNNIASDVTSKPSKLIPIILVTGAIGVGLYLKNKAPGS